MQQRSVYIGKRCVVSVARKATYEKPKLTAESHIVLGSAVLTVYTSLGFILQVIATTNLAYEAFPLFTKHCMCHVQDLGTHYHLTHIQTETSHGTPIPNKSRYANAMFTASNCTIVNKWHMINWYLHIPTQQPTKRCKENPSDKRA